MQVTDERIAQFERDGFTIIEGLLDQQRVGQLHAAMDRVYAGEYRADRRPPRLRKRVTPFGAEDSVHWILNARVLDDELWKLATDPQLGEIAARLLRSESVSIVEDQLLDKPPGGRPVNYHQDYSYWPFSRATQMCTAWLALVDMSIEHGPLQLARGSHTWGHSSRPKELIRGSEDELLSAAAAARPDDAELDSVTAVVPAGSAVFFHCLTFHGSDRNQATGPRRAISLHWAGAECRMNLAETASHDYPYFFARLADEGPIVNKYMPTVFPGQDAP
ncbi:phytanoyl-CoA dioxygenase family protein [Haliangium ochraceum]|uniref:Phytanoyl-CoA dioxygenase n=1 Tax=Haliangium ochraceum (strain DSM 14365 / JCM 11303 / SMP-2) TaxID=502025 RepID=D0LUN6_HALO1|nr:phytanoyl-CoA dioxygenase family protein [Haliangium ochraceum]ACY13926.1 Phytanoyl-CoA dioxygenase [Haliangium ochraceum DSM 14365]